AAVHAQLESAEAAAAWLLEQLEAPPFRRSAPGAEPPQGDPLLIVTAHDAAARLLMTAQEPDPHAAVAIIMRLLARDDLALSADQRRLLAATRIDQLLTRAGDITGFAPQALALRALHAAGDPERRIEAIALLRQAAQQTEDAEVRDLARFEAAALLLTTAASDAERAEGVDLLISMLQELDEWPRAPEAAHAATAHARALLAAEPAGRGRRGLLERAL